MELLLWRWSTAVQITSALMIAVFFLVLSRSVRRIELRPWVNAWLVNVGALLVTIAFWFLQPKSQLAFIFLRFSYFLTKTTFVVLLVRGAWGFLSGHRSARWLSPMLVLVAIYSAASAVVANTIDRIGTSESLVLTILFAAGAVILLRRSSAPGAGWLAFGFAARSLLALLEMAAHGSQLVPNAWSSSATVRFFLASYSSFDTGAEWVIALGCVLMVYRTIQHELTQTNADLLAAQEKLQQLADHDPLTGLSNRRALPGIMREAFSSGATILFFDLDDFKQLNDGYGHQFGDECLKRFAAALQESFRPEDRVIRYAGDEFVVVAKGVEPAQIEERIDLVRQHLAGSPEIRFAAGCSYLPVQGDPEVALRAADEAMYRQKEMKVRRVRTG